MIRQIFGHLGVDVKVEDAVMIGDRKYDILGAREVGMDSIGALWGYGSREELAGAGATWLAEDYADLVRLLR